MLQHTLTLKLHRAQRNDPDVERQRGDCMEGEAAPGQICSEKEGGWGGGWGGQLGRWC